MIINIDRLSINTSPYMKRMFQSEWEGSSMNQESTVYIVYCSEKYIWIERPLHVEPLIHQWTLSEPLLYA